MPSAHQAPTPMTHSYIKVYINCGKVLSEGRKHARFFFKPPNVVELFWILKLSLFNTLSAFFLVKAALHTFCVLMHCCKDEEWGQYV